MDIPFGSVRKNVKQNRRSIIKHIYTSSKRYVFKLNFWSKDAYSNHPQIICVLKCKNEILLDEFEFAPFTLVHFSMLVLASKICMFYYSLFVHAIETFC